MSFIIYLIFYYFLFAYEIAIRLLNLNILQLMRSRNEPQQKKWRRSSCGGGKASLTFDDATTAETP
jgi:hypothetical protein